MMIKIKYYNKILKIWLKIIKVLEVENAAEIEEVLMVKDMIIEVIV